MHKCAGEGVMRGEEVISVKIPAGVAEGMQLSVSGKGNAHAVEVLTVTCW